MPRLSTIIALAAVAFCIYAADSELAPAQLFRDVVATLQRELSS